ncbi:MAG: SDR family oxidoreductase [Bacteroidota bacterium]
MELQNKVAVVTGANKGIGHECVQQLLEKGAFVVGICRSGCSHSHPNYTCLTADVRHWEGLSEAFGTIIEKHGKIDILINNAGLGYFGHCDELPIEQWHEMFDTNVTGLFYATRLALPTMKQQGLGHIVNISSIAGLEGYQQVSAYCATKFAVRGFSDALYKEVRDFGVKVTCVYPGAVKTNFFRHSENIKAHDNMLMPQDVAQQIIYCLESPPNFHNVNLEIRPLKPRG